MNESRAFRINPHPEKHAGLDVVLYDNGDVGLGMAADHKVGFKLSPEAALGLASLIQLTVKSDSWFHKLVSFGWLRYICLLSHLR